jgi:hypothetical protein
MASSVSVANKNKADIRDGNEYKIRKWLVLKFHGSGHLPNHILTVSIEETTKQLKITFLNPTVECCCHGNQLSEL